MDLQAITAIAATIAAVASCMSPFMTVLANILLTTYRDMRRKVNKDEEKGITLTPQSQLVCHFKDPNEA